MLLATTSVASAQQKYENAQDSILKSLMLQEVEVVAQKPIVKMDTDKLTYDVTQDPDAKASTVLDMLRKVPMVTVDGQDNITVNGSSSFKIYVDGKPNVMFSSNPSQIFKSMPASTVKSIEVVTNPGAKYDAEGASGVLNIIMNRASFTPGGPSPMEALNGINGNVRLQGGNKSYGGSLFLSGQQNKFSFSANAMLSKQIMKGTEMEMIQEQTSPVPSTVTTIQEGGRTRTPFGMANVSLGYELDEMSSISATVGLTMFDSKNSGLTRSILSGGMYGNGFSYDMNSDTKSKRSGINLSADYQRFLNKDRSSFITFTYLFSNNPSKSENSSIYDHSKQLPAGFEAFLTDRFSDNDNRSTEHTAQIDYTTPLAKNHTLNAGAKFTSLSSSSIADFFTGIAPNLQYQELMSSDYSNGKSILAGYGEYEGRFGKFSTRAGLRYEHTWQSVEYRKGNTSDYKDDYGNLIPSLSLSYNLGMTSNIGLTYNLRISRPGITYLNPYVDRSSNTALTYGNPDLEVEKAHNMGIVYNLFTQKLTLNVNLRYALTDNAIEQYSFYDNDNLLNTTYGNIVKRQNTNLSIFANYLLHKNTRIFTNAGLSYSDMSSKQLSVSNSGWHYNMMLGLQQTLPLDIKVGAFLISNSKTKTLQGTTTGFNMISANISKSFLDDKLNIGLQAMTGLSKGGCLSIETMSKGADFTNSTKIRVPMTNVTLSLTYNFGNSKVRAKLRQSKVKSDVIEHTGSMEQIGNQMNSNN